jgi:hypothetical protein
MNSDFPRVMSVDTCRVLGKPSPELVAAAEEAGAYGNFVSAQLQGEVWVPADPNLGLNTPVQEVWVEICPLGAFDQSQAS